MTYSPDMSQTITQRNTNISASGVYFLKESNTQDASVSLLLKGMKDFSAYQNKNIIAVGDSRPFYNLISKWGQGGIYLDGNDYINVTPVSNEFIFGPTNWDFTIEFWIYYISGNGYFLCANNAGSGPFGIGIGYDTTQYLVVDRVSASRFMNSSQTTLSQEWTHIALTRQGNVWRLFKNGTQVSTLTNATNFSLTVPETAGITIGRSDASIVAAFEDIRITKGLARYTSNFTRPTEPFAETARTPGSCILPLASKLKGSTITLSNQTSQVTGAICQATDTINGAYDPYYLETTALLDFGSMTNLTEIVDKSPYGANWIPYADAKLVTQPITATTGAFSENFPNNTVLYLDGTGDYIASTPNDNFRWGYGDFTVEMLVRIGSWLNTIQWYNTPGTVTSSSACGLWTPTDASIRYINPSGTGAIVSGGHSTNVWYHVVVSRKSGRTRLFVDGSLKGTIDDNYYYGGGRFFVGASSTNGSTATGDYATSYIDNVRVTNAARYEAGFTVSKTLLPGGIGLKPGETKRVYSDGTGWFTL